MFLLNCLLGEIILKLRNVFGFVLVFGVCLFVSMSYLLL